MVVGALREFVFSASSLTAKPIKHLIWSVSAPYTTHQRHAGNALTEFTGLDPDKITFDIFLSSYLGVDPMTEITRIWRYERNAVVLPLVLGNHGYGRYRWTITSHKTKPETYDGHGNITSATVTLTLQEYLRS